MSLYPTVPTLQESAQRAWAIKRLHDERAMDRLAALHSFDTLCDLNPNPHLRRLCETITYRMFPEVARPQPDVEPPADSGVEVFAR